VDAVPADVRVGVLARRGAGQATRRAHVVVVRAATAAARSQGSLLVPCNSYQKSCYITEIGVVVICNYLQHQTLSQLTL
jgi:hypothetical protein